MAVSYKCCISVFRRFCKAGFAVFTIVRQYVRRRINFYFDCSDAAVVDSMDIRRNLVVIPPFDNRNTGIYFYDADNSLFEYGAFVALSKIIREVIYGRNREFGS